MPPQQQYPPQYPPGPGQPERYDFFMNPGNQPKPSKLPLPGLSSGGSFGKQIALIAGIAIAVILVLYVVATLFRGNDSNVASLIKIAQQQTELARVATLGTSSAESAPTKNFAQTAALSLTSSQQDLVSFLADNGQKVSTKELSLLQNKGTDSALTTATQASDFDQTFTPIMQNQLKTYEATLQQTYKAATNKSERQLLSNDFSGAELILQSINNKTY